MIEGELMPVSWDTGRQQQLARRNFLQITAGIVAATFGAQTPAYPRGQDSAAGSQPVDSLVHPAIARPRGAVYVPARAYNAFQMWRDYDPAITRRDARYARSLRLNAFRLWLSYEFWLQDREALRQGFNNLLQVCSAAGIKVMPVLFEGVGVEPTPQNETDANPFKATALLSPSSEMVADSRQWNGPRDYVDWYMDHFRNDQRLLAIEIQNEPHTVPRQIFARAMVAQAAKRKNSVPLTLGGTNLRESLFFSDLGLDVLESHRNFPPSAAFVRNFIQEEIVDPSKVLGRPVWLTEWQRIRPSGTGWGRKQLHGNEWAPDYASMAPIVRSSGIGNFFWSLMLKPAYLLAQREKGTLNGVFHEDGAVWSLADARAICGESRFATEERKAWPEWARAIPQSLGIG
jgi:hypothetical protein